ncbi:MAG: FG-GAP-like repeat-containing protein [Phycisphaerae bacterium]|nr:FG-GAP-like repeat-containing protein [Phycisphaerae bacterium]
MKYTVRPAVLLLAAVSFLGTEMASQSSGAAPPAFSNQAGPAGVGVSHATSGFTFPGYAGGACIGDFNRDGFQDFLFLSGGLGNKPDYLFINNGDGTFTDQAAAWGLTAVHKGKGASATDFNNDGWTDIYVSSGGPTGQNQMAGHNKLYRNNGNGTFTNVAVSAGVNAPNPNTQDSWGSCWGDFDRDGDLDLFVAGFSSSSAGNAGNRLFRNDGNETFTDITTMIGLWNGVGPVAGFSPRFVDTDGDRWPELLLVGDFKGAGYIGSRYFRNNAGTSFTDLTVSAHVGQEENGMGHTVGDFDNDGRLDWYATSIYLPAASWTGNKLYRNIGTHQFSQYALSAGVNNGGYGWGAVAVDFDHDTRTDIGATNGDASGGGTFGNDPTRVWMNNGDSTFTDQAPAAGLIHNGAGRCMINFDYDNDGDQDVILVTNNGPLALYRNDLDLLQPDTQWLRVFLDTQGSETLAPFGLGSKVCLTIGKLTLMRSVDAGCTHLGTTEFSAHFGLGANTVIDELKVQWPDGSDTILRNVASNQTITISRERPCSPDLTGDGTVDGADLALLLGQWGGRGSADLTEDGLVDAADLAIMLGAWGGCR